MLTKSDYSRWIFLVPVLLVWGCAKPVPPPAPFVGTWENTHSIKGGQFLMQIIFEANGTGQVQQITHMTGKGTKKTADTAAIRPLHWHSDGDRYVILLYQPEGAGQVRLEWSISNDGKVLSLIHTDNSTDVYYRPGAQTGSEQIAVGTPERRDLTAGTASTNGEKQAGTTSSAGEPVEGEKRVEALLEAQ